MARGTEWPLSRAVDTDFHLPADGCLTHEPPSTAEQPEEFAYDSMDPVPTTGGALFMADDFRPGPLDQTVVEARETSWSSPPNRSPTTSR